MKIAVLVKQTPDTAELPRVSADDVNRGEVKTTMALNPWDEHVAEEGVRLTERFDAETVAISMGASTAVDALRHTLAIGINNAVLVESTGMPLDIIATATILSDAIRAQGDVDLVITGKQSVDAGTGSVYVAIACMLDRPLVTNVTKVVDIADGSIIVEREMSGKHSTVSVPLPAIISVGKQINEPRYPSFVGIRNANRAEIPVIRAADLVKERPTKKTVWTNVRLVEKGPEKTIMIDGATPQEKAAKLVDYLLGEKVV